ncbi:sucCoAalpha: succinate-CoA ligase, alpha subunit [Rubrobacter radiotolerans]|uniref:Succinate--CoA ligase [ADP-forming] subunit alpha n=1 Tax=Rubrobacter radiotolerans TaxID=42256 RepID=A0A023X388_RUBRA|nr:succinate--CoA ligase subunit alpha [Rubrobacter radiotolerans]AHY46534.1 sucCoAalpha: succinate-CoA ligase, alpha subunit [Rubrobacter radiotolerans]MDX5893942.1 succinate--CoA ligase subunit alpha [Rubrobacter radiotolerans]SMC04823.1 succinyl-CoA synthetase alpha subunit [Rubrobacter radiotolerans DSM 5868]
MAILVDENTKLLVQGITGREGGFHTGRMIDSGTDVVAGVTPGKGGQDFKGVPVFNTVKDAVKETGANASVIFVPPPFAADAIFESLANGIETVCCIAEGVPVHDMLRVASYIKSSDATLIGPNCPGMLSPGKANVSIMPQSIFSEGNVGVVSRSGTLTYQVVNELTQMGIGQTTAVGIGGDPIIGTNFIEILQKFEADPDTEAIAMIGEIGGNAEQQAAEYIKANMKTPVVAYIAGFTAPEGKTMGHAGAIVSGGDTTAEAKSNALRKAGIAAAENPSEVAQLIADALGK